MVDINICMCIIFALIIVLFADTILDSMPILNLLFTDKTNYALLIVLVIFIIILDPNCGIILALLVLYMSMYFNTRAASRSASPNASQMPLQMSSQMSSSLGLSSASPTPSLINISSQNHNLFDNVINDNIIKQNSSNGNEEDTILSNNNEILSESEFIYNNTKPFPNNNLKPYQPTMIEKFASTDCKDVKNDFITNVGEPERSGYDVSGCRYDMKNSPQNLTKYGPPLAQCSAYDTNKAKICGTVFYPLNG